MKSILPLFRGTTQWHFRIHGWICRRCLSTTSWVASGHSRWSTIKHDKGKNDIQKNKLRSVLAKELMQASKCMEGNKNDGLLLLSNVLEADALTTSIWAGSGMEPKTGYRDYDGEER
jgi:hypothetical protein